MNPLPPIPGSLGRQCEEIRRRAGPVLVFGTALVSVLLLLQNYVGAPPTPASESSARNHMQGAPLARPLAASVTASAGGQPVDPHSPSLPGNLAQPTGDSSPSPIRSLPHDTKGQHPFPNAN